MNWKLYYQDSTFSSDDGAWNDAPARGVQALALPHPTANRQIQTNDFYFMSPWADEPCAADLFGIIDYLLEIRVLTPNQAITDLAAADLFNHGIKLGRSLSDTEYNRVHTEIVADADLTVWGPKTTRTPHER